MALPFGEALQLLRQVGWNMGDDYGVTALIAQFQNVTDAMNLGNQRRFIRWNAKTRTQSPRSERVLQRLHEFVNSFSCTSGDCHTAWKTLRVRLGKFAVPCHAAA